MESFVFKTDKIQNGKNSAIQKIIQKIMPFSKYVCHFGRCVNPIGSINSSIV